jgi:phasin family protein
VRCNKTIFLVDSRHDLQLPEIAISLKFIKEYHMIAGFDTFTEAQQTWFKAAQQFGQAAIAGSEKLVALQFAATKAAAQESQAQFEAAVAAKTPAEFAQIQMAAVKPAADKAMAYARHAYEINQETGKVLAQTLQEQAVQSRAWAESAVETMSKNAPVGSEPFVKATHSAFAAAQNAMDQVMNAGRQVTATATEEFKKASKKR